MKTREEDYYQLTELNEQLENYFANTIIPQLFVDAQLILRKFTPPAMTQFTFTEADVNRDFHEVKDNIKYPTIIENIEEVIRTGEILEKEIQTTDKEWYQMNILPYVVRNENRRNGVIITFVNITYRVNALRETEKLLARNDTLMYALAHDVRQPLSRILLLKEGLRQSFRQNEKKEFEKLTGQLTSTVTSITRLIGNFVKENKPIPENAEDKSRVDIQHIFQEVSESFKNEIHALNLEITTDFKSTEIKFSRTNLRSIVYNLFSNAIKFKDNKRPLAIHVSTEKEGHNIVLKMRDSGRGIPEKKLKTIFRKAERLNPEIDGTGMGLYIITRMVENNKGKISVESKEGEGTTFTVTFPAD